MLTRYSPWRTSSVRKVRLISNHNRVSSGSLRWTPNFQSLCATTMVWITPNSIGWISRQMQQITCQKLEDTNQWASSRSPRIRAISCTWTLRLPKCSLTSLKRTSAWWTTSKAWAKSNWLTKSWTSKSRSKRFWNSTKSYLESLKVIGNSWLRIKRPKGSLRREITGNLHRHWSCMSRLPMNLSIRTVSWPRLCSRRRST